MSECLAAAKEKKYHSFLLQHFRPMRYLFDAAIAAGIEKDFIEHLKNSVIKRNSLNWLSDECKARLKTKMPDWWISASKHLEEQR